MVRFGILRRRCIEIILLSVVMVVPSYLCAMELEDDAVAEEKGPWDYWWKDSREIIGELRKHPQTVSAFTATSPVGVNAIVENVMGNKVLEVGAGPGTVSLWLVKMLEKKFPEGYRYDGAECLGELYYEFVSRLDPFPKDRVHTYQAYFPNWHPVGNEVGQNFYDTVVTTVPFTRLPIESVASILNAMALYLKPGGTFIYISLMGARSTGYATKGLKIIANKLMCWRDKETKKKAMQEFIDYKNNLKMFDAWLNDNFEKPVKTIKIWRNLTPIYVFVCTKNDVKVPAKLPSKLSDVIIDV
jgi:phospholipid N-methyltransferase